MLTAFFTAERTRLAKTTQATVAGNILGFLVAMVPNHDWTWLRAVHAYLRSRAKRQPVKKGKVVHAADLFSLGMDLVKCSLSNDKASTADPIAFRDGLIIATMASAPARISNFASVEIVGHLVHDAAGWCLRFDEDETKEDKFDEWPLPDKLGRYLEVYLEHIRPVLIGSSSKANAGNALWIDDTGAAMSDQTMRKRIKERTAAKFGVPTLPHAFRKSAATTFVIELPEQAIKVSALLNHTPDGKVTEKHYIVAQRQLASQAWHQIYERRRARAKQSIRELQHHGS
ncbi:hypothetical protein WV31_19070 [Magnetospirillum sp. ME-1]|nr:hypothetical protein WV31_19070 [Magnetospirillum sp. ME-1]